MARCLLLFCFLIWASRVYYDQVAVLGELLPLDLMGTPDGQLFYVQVEVTDPHEEPKPVTRPFNLLVCTTYDTTWIPSQDLSPARGFPYSGAQGTRHPSSVSGGGFFGHDYYIYYGLKVKLGSRLAVGQTLAVARMVTIESIIADPYVHSFGLPSNSNLDGALGLAGDSAYPMDEEYLFQRLYYSNRVFSLYINNTALLSRLQEDQQAVGALVLGGVDNKYYTGDISYVGMNDDLVEYYLDGQARQLPFWGSKKSLTIRSIQLDWTRTNHTRQKPLQLPESISTGRINITTTRVSLKLDSSTKLFVGQRIILDRIHMDHIGATKVGLKGMYVFDDCHLDNKPDLVFSLGSSFELSIRPEDYVIEDELEGRRCCLSAFHPYNRDGWVFGTKFLRKYYTVFDYERERIGFATPT